MVTQNFQSTIIQRAQSISSSSSTKRILLSEGDDPRMQQAAKQLADLNFNVVVLAQSVTTLGFPKIEVINPARSKDRNMFAEQYLDLRKGKGESPEEVSKLMASSLYFGAMMLRTGKVDTAVSGAVNTTSDVFRAGIRCLGLSPGFNTASSFFLMILPDGKVLTYADCGLVPYPTSSELCDITINAARNHRKLTGAEPRVAMLSFSTKGSAKHERVDHVIEATNLVKNREPKLIVDGELQFDAAFVPTVASRKAPNSVIKGDANVFIFPNLDAGNIAYKITERIGNAQAIGPLLQGLSKPWLDLSRGCSADDIVLVASVGLLLV